MRQIRAGEEGLVSPRYNNEKVMDSSHPATLPQLPIRDLATPEVSIIVPARNEEAAIGDCLKSLIAQASVTFEIIVVDDVSADRTREIALSFAGVRVIAPEPPREGWTGKNNALIAGAKEARANWLLFTDADTTHLTGSLARALEEARSQRADLLSYSPEQVVVTFSEKAVMPVVFAELVAQYPPHKVRDQHSGIVAANGQYILVRRAAYESVGGHSAVATEILEDVALARLFRNAGRKVYFRYGAGAVRTRMYRDWPQLREGWTKNLALLFPQPGRLALQNLLVWLALWLMLAVALFGTAQARAAWGAVAALFLLVYRRIRVAHFRTANNLIAIAFGLPMFVYLLLRSKKAHAQGIVEWKGRAYRVASENQKSEIKRPVEPIAAIENQRLRTGN
jgi:glycosyltransferase involved in cell wall biosynthesis